MGTADENRKVIEGFWDDLYRQDLVAAAASGESMALPVASVHELAGGRITRWRDYRDMNVLVAAAPPWWFEHVIAGWK
ncbi:MAG TPA: limonene-1,2-epoxide hydrolase family protein [Acidimicrobiales bacterium]|nr:limonene-1,2-epoxide hydrolase family protein [Acidimicrobiales bacterium]